MKDQERIHYELQMLACGLQGLGLSMAIHHCHDDGGITEIHATQLGHLVEACGVLASRLATDLDLARDKQERGVRA